MAEPFLSEIKLVPYNFAPRGWALCDGQQLSIAQNTALFSLIGTYYGGDGRVNFNLPDLRERFVVPYGQGNGLSDYAPGDVIGAPAVTLNPSQLPSHTHPLAVSNAPGDQTSPVGHYPAVAPAGMGYTDGTGAVGTMPGAVSVTGAGAPQAHENHQPYLVLNYIIALVGIFPSRN